MKYLILKSASLSLVLSSLTACSGKEPKVDKRQAKVSALKGQVDSGNLKVEKPVEVLPGVTPVAVEPTPGTEVPPIEAPPLPAVEIKMPDLKLSAAAALVSVKAEDIILVNKINATDFMIFGKGGKSWSYKPGAAAADQLKAFEAIVVDKDSTIYTLPDLQFWTVNQTKFGRRNQTIPVKPEDKGDIPSQQFATEAFKGDVTKLKVLFISLDEVIFHLGDHIEIVTVKPTGAAIKHLPIAKLPVDLKGDVQAGKTDHGYWFRANGVLHFFAANDVKGVSQWTKSPLVLDPADTTQLALWPDEAGVKFSGPSLGLSAAGLVTDAVAAP